MRYSFCVCILLTFLFLSESIAQLTPQEAIVGMGRGINLGNTLEPPLEGSWNNGPAKESHFDAYMEAGFTNIRIPVRWDRHTASTAPFNIDEEWMNRVEEVVDWGLSRGFYITLNGHHEDWLKNDYSNPTLQARYDSIWVQIVNRFQNKSEKLLLEIINEPNGMTRAEVDDLNERILGIIRRVDETRIVIYSGNMYSNSEQLLQAAIPDDDYLIGYYHAYDPWQFSGQGQGTWGTTNDYQQLTNKYQSVKNWSIANDIPIHHSEFGAVRSCDFNSRMRIYAHNVEQCVVNGFAFSVWDDGGDFGILNRIDDSWPEVKEILMHYHEDSPNKIFSSLVIDTVTDQPSILIEWNNRAITENKIVLERSEGSTSSFQKIADLPSGASNYIDKDIEAGKTYTYRMYTNRADSTLLHGYPTRIKITATQQSPYGGAAIEIPGQLEVEEYDLGGEGLAYHDDEPANIPNGFRQDEGVDIGTHNDGFILEYVAQGEWIEYSVNVTTAGEYRVDAEVASEVANGAFNITFDRNDASTTFTTPSTGNWYTFTEITANNTIELEAGEQQMRLEITNDNPFNVDRLTFTLESSSSTNATKVSDHGLLVAPNPTSDWLEIEIDKDLVFTDAKLEVYQTSGLLIGTYELTANSLRLDVSDFKNGIYLLRLPLEDKVILKRILKL